MDGIVWIGQKCCWCVIPWIGQNRSVLSVSMDGSEVSKVWVCMDAKCSRWVSMDGSEVSLMWVSMDVKCPRCGIV